MIAEFFRTLGLVVLSMLASGFFFTAVPDAVKSAASLVGRIPLSPGFLLSQPLIELSGPIAGFTVVLIVLNLIWKHPVRVINVDTIAKKFPKLVGQWRYTEKILDYSKGNSQPDQYTNEGQISIAIKDNFITFVGGKSWAKSDRQKTELYTWNSDLSVFIEHQNCLIVFYRVVPNPNAPIRGQWKRN
jgi:hypothetical protein